jgi:hypothetical protein
VEGREKWREGMDLSQESGICWMEWGMGIVSELSGEEEVVRNLFTRWSAKRGAEAFEGLVGTRGVCGLGSGRDGTLVGGRRQVVLDAHAPGEGTGLSPRANHLQQLMKSIAHGEWNLKVEGEWSLGVSHIAGARSFDAVLGVRIDLIDPQDLRGESDALWWTKSKGEGTDKRKEDGGCIGDTKDFDGCADECEPNGCRAWCGQGPGTGDTGHGNAARVECREMIVST